MSVEKEFNKINPNTYSIMTPFFRTGPKTETFNNTLSKINTIVIHWTAGASLTSDINTLNSAGYGYHFLIEADGSILQGAPVKKQLSHAGYSYGPNGKWLNGHSISISFVMRGDETKKKGSTKFNTEQIKSCQNLILDLKEAVPSLKYITGHHWVSPGRKIDPYTFPFETFITKLNGFELWKTGYHPFPKGLTNCKCVKTDSNGNCLKSQGLCTGPGDYGYSERNLSKEVYTFFSSDKYGE